jgi:hypothetical protein
MNNKYIKLYDNIGSKFTVENSDILIGVALTGFKTLSIEHVGSVVPYLLKNKELWETGLGLVKNIDNKIYLERVKIVRSSNNDQIVDFSLNSNDNNFYLFANEYNFNTGFNNAIQINNNSTLEAISATYLIKLLNNLELNLPSAKDHQGLSLDFKTDDGNYLCRLVDDNQEIILLKNNYCKIISDGNKWIELINLSQNDNGGFSVNSLSSELFSSLSSDPQGSSGSLQYNNNGVFGEAPVYVGSNQKLLLGSTLESSSNAILPTSGNYPVVFNNQNLASDFIVKGSGDKNLFFGYEGRLGLNIPSGARPQTSLHIVTNSCQEGLRLENRNQCYPANITLYHKPNSVISQNSTIGTINLSAKNSSSNQVDYVQLLARANSYTTNATKGEFAIKIEDSNSKIEALKVNSSGTFISNSLYISSLKYTIPTTSGNVLMSDNNGNILLSSINNIPINISTLKYTQTASSGNILISDGSGSIILTNVNNTPIIDLLDGAVITFTGICS